MSVAQLFRRLPEDAPPQTLAQQVHDQAQDLAYELRQFRSGWSYLAECDYFENAG
jgi:hypothetical protein